MKYFLFNDKRKNIFKILELPWFIFVNKFQFLRCLKKTTCRFIEKILAFRKKVTIRNKTHVKHGQKKQTIFFNERTISYDTRTITHGTQIIYHDWLVNNNVVTTLPVYGEKIIYVHLWTRCSRNFITMILQGIATYSIWIPPNFAISVNLIYYFHFFISKSCILHQNIHVPGRFLK